jgi:protease-4
MALAVVLLVLLALTWIGLLGRSFMRAWFSLGTSAGRTAGPPLLEVVIEDAGADDKIAVVDIEGILWTSLSEAGGHNLVEMLHHQLKRAREDNAVKAVILRLDTPGGEVLAADEMCQAVAEFQDKSGKPVVASMSSLAASGGYYVAAPCRWIVAHELTITGSIGVVMHGYNYRGLMDKLGLRPEVYKSGKFKDMMGGDREEEEILPEERQMLQALINEAHGRFKEVIAKGRQQANQKNQGSGRKLADKWLDFTDGRVLSGRQAHELGFVDELGSLQTAVQRAKKLTHVSRANLIQYQQPFNLANLFRLFAKSEARSIKLDIGADLPRLQVGRLYFLFEPGLR